MYIQRQRHSECKEVQTSHRLEIFSGDKSGLFPFECQYMTRARLPSMGSFRCRRGIRGCRAGSAHESQGSWVRKISLIWLPILMCSLAPAQNMQLSPQRGNSWEAQSPLPRDCSDPLLADEQACSSESQQEYTSVLTSKSRLQLAGEHGEQTGSPNTNYSDTERLSKQASTLNQPRQAQLPAEPLTEFQKFAASTTGQVLAIYGANLFRNVPSTFAPLDMTPVPPDYLIGPGDELRIRVWGQISFQANVSVDRSGEIFIPQVGPVHVAEMPFSQLETHLRSAIGRVYHNFDLTADVGRIHAIQVYVSGQARRPGLYTVSSLGTLVDVLFASGGPSSQGSVRGIQLRRGSSMVTSFDLYDLLTRGDKSKDVKLQSGDVIFIPHVGPQVAVTGSVRNPAIYELRPDESLAGLFADAGGVSAVASETRVSIERIEDHRDRHSMEVVFDARGLATSLADGDIVHVYSIVPLYRKTVILRGNTANPGRFAWHSGMHISDLIPDEESLITRNYWWKRAQLGLPLPEFEPTPGFADMRQPAESHALILRSPQVNGSNMPNQQRDQQNPVLSANQQASNSSLATQQPTAPSRIPAATHLTEIGKLAPEIDWDYAVIERLDPVTLKTRLIPFDLGNLVLQHDSSQDLELQSGDVVSIFSEADIRVPIAQQTKLVTLAGEFNHAGVYTVQPGETFRHLVERAGGLTPEAYLYGSEFTRESTRAMQQARIDEYVQSLSMEMQRSNLALAVSSANTAQDLSSGAATLNSQRDLLAGLRRISAAGRIVLRFAPNSTGTNTFPDITMEDGDRFVVPPVPATVNVFGAVYNQNSFLYKRGLRVESYLQQAGGPNRNADRVHAFIICANGEVVGRERGKTIWKGSEFDKMRLNPGDTIVVPEKNLRPSALRGILAWSQLFSQFALGAAALSVIK
jgi:protein involved in polysaccharide export with SLBB domain